MSNEDLDRTIQKTEWTDSLLEDLIAALSGGRDDATVRAFAQELMDDKDLPISYLVQKTQATAGTAAAQRLDLLIRGRHAIEKEQTEKSKPAGGVIGMVRRFFS
jgi:hypothetical protein